MRFLLFGIVFTAVFLSVFAERYQLLPNGSEKLYPDPPRPVRSPRGSVSCGGFLHGVVQHSLCAARCIQTGNTGGWCDDNLVCHCR